MRRLRPLAQINPQVIIVQLPEFNEWRNIHNEELNDLYFSYTIVGVIKSRRMRWAGYVAHMGRGAACKAFWWVNLGRPRRRWEDNIIADLQEVGCGGMDWIELAQIRDRWLALANAAMNLRVP
jgi:hypothetical protein